MSLAPDVYFEKHFLTVSFYMFGSFAGGQADGGLL